MCEQNGKCRYRISTVGVRDTGLVNLFTGDEWKLKEAVATVGPVSAAIDASQLSFLFYDRGNCGSKVKANILDQVYLVKVNPSML